MRSDRTAPPIRSAGRTAALLGGLSRHAFLRDHWGRRPLLVRNAVEPSVTRIADLALLRRLAARDEVESRLVERNRGRWRVHHGPVPEDAVPGNRKNFGKNRGTDSWTLLVNGVNHHVDRAQQLLERFAFLSWARIDDVMASYAVAGGGVGPHVDSYDVFLIQGLGRRRWRIAAPRDFELVESAPLRLIRDFRPEDEYVLAPGDMLYLPPGWGHDGVALEPSITLSVGFRTPRADELGAAFLDWMHERRLPGAARLPTGRPGGPPGEIPGPLVQAAAAMLQGLRPGATEARRFIGEYLSTPKPHVVFCGPGRPLGAAAFADALARGGIALDPKSILLYRGATCYLNGESFTPPRALRPCFRMLADTRRVATWPRDAAALLYDWYRAGFILTAAQLRARLRARSR